MVREYRIASPPRHFDPWHGPHGFPSILRSPGRDGSPFSGEYRNHILTLAWLRQKSEIKTFPRKQSYEKY